MLDHLVFIREVKLHVFLSSGLSQARLDGPVVCLTTCKYMLQYIRELKQHVFLSSGLSQEITVCDSLVSANDHLVQTIH